MNNKFVAIAVALVAAQPALAGGFGGIPTVPEIDAAAGVAAAAALAGAVALVRERFKR